MSETSSIPGAALVSGAVKIASNIMAWGYSFCTASKTNISDIVEKSPELQQIKEDEATFGDDEPSETEDEPGEEQAGSSTQQTQKVAERIEESGPPESEPSTTKDEQPLTTIEESPTKLEQPKVEATTPELETETQPVAEKKPEKPTEAQRASTVLVQMKELRIKSDYFGVVTPMEKLNLITLGKEINKLCTQVPTPDGEGAEKKLLELKLALKTIDGVINAFGYKVKQYASEVDKLGIKFARTISLAENDAQEKLNDRFQVASEAYYAQCSQPRHTYQEDLVEKAVQDLRDLVTELETYDPVAIATKDAEDFKTFEVDDVSTWKVLPLRIVGKAKGQVDTSESIVGEVTLARTGDRNRPALIATGVAMHAHAVGGSGGITFAYNHIAGKKVEPVIYDYASKRQDNDYQWLGAGKRGGPAPLSTSSVPINRSVPPPY